MQNYRRGLLSLALACLLSACAATTGEHNRPLSTSRDMITQKELAMQTVAYDAIFMSVRLEHQPAVFQPWSHQAGSGCGLNIVHVPENAVWGRKGAQCHGDRPGVHKGRDRVTLLAAELWPPTHATA
ncbi:hypothetical protein BH24GEM2_BH24GEM2_17690 [soil metagenome]|jgi:hypothetical protein